MTVCSIALFVLLLEPPQVVEQVPRPESVIEPDPNPIPISSHANRPTWTNARAHAPPSRDPKVPFDGGGAIVTGSIMIVASLAMASGSIVQAARPDRPGEGLLALGAILVGAAGPGVLVGGVKTRKKFRTTELGRVVGGPTTGRAMQAGSLIAMAGGSLGLLTGVWRFSSPGYCPHCIEPPSDAVALMGIGPGLMTAGAIMFMISQINRTKYRKWMRERPFRVQPGVAFGPGTMQVGLAGRF